MTQFRLIKPSFVPRQRHQFHFLTSLLRLRYYIGPIKHLNRYQIVLSRSNNAYHPWTWYPYALYTCLHTRGTVLGPIAGTWLNSNGKCTRAEECVTYTSDTLVSDRQCHWLIIGASIFCRPALFSLEFVATFDRA